MGKMMQVGRKQFAFFVVLLVLTCRVFPAMAAPSVSTGTYYAPSLESVTLFGLVNADSTTDPVNVTFYYSSTSSFGPWSSVAATPGTVSGTSSVQVEATISIDPDLEYGTTHWYYVGITRTTPPLDMAATVWSFRIRPMDTVVETMSVQQIRLDQATIRCEFGSVGMPMPTAHGVVWNTTGNPTISDSVQDDGPVYANAYDYYSTMSPLQLNTTYYVRAFATTESETMYGNEITVTTYGYPSVTTQAMSNVTATSATGNGTVTDLGNPSPANHGFVWNTTGSPTGADNYSDEGSVSTTGTYTSSLTGLSPNTTYYVRAYTYSAVGHVYGNEVSFTTLPQGATVTTQEITGIGTTSATGNGNVTDLGVPSPTAFGFAWNTAGSPTLSDNSTNEGTVSATGAFSSAITGLDPDTTYYVRAYATNAAGTVYGNEMSFTTLLTPVWTLTVMMDGAGLGTVVSNPAGIDCPGNDSASFSEETTVTLTATPDNGYALDGWAGADVPGNGPCAFTLMEDMTVTATFNVDSDGDGISDLVENAGPDSGDGNSDGIPDADQANVATFKTIYGDDVTLISEPETRLDNVMAMVPATGAAWMDFPLGAFGFTITGLTPGAGTVLTAVFHTPSPEVESYYNYGPTADDPEDHWYVFVKYDSFPTSTWMDVATGRTVVTLTLVDGERGDNDLAADGSIVGAGAPTDVSLTGGSGCFLQALGVF